MASSCAHRETPLNGARLPWHRPQVVELSPAEAKEVRERLLTDAERKEARREFLTAEIKDWVANRRQRSDDYMRADEIGAAKGRPFLLLRALLDGMAYCYRENIGADERGANFVVGVFVVDAILSDNDLGYSTASAPRVAKLLGCNEKSVLRARELLVENRVICREKHRGIEDRHWPVINRAIAGQGVSVTWWLDATSAAVKRGRPSTKPQTAVVRPLEKTPDPKPENPGPLGSDDSTLLTSLKRGAAQNPGGTAGPGFEGGPQSPPPKTNGIHSPQCRSGQAVMMEAFGGEAAYAERNIIISPSGKLTIGPEFRDELREAYTDSQIDGALDTALSAMGSNRRKLDIAQQVRRQCVFRKSDPAKATGATSRKVFDR